MALETEFSDETQRGLRQSQAAMNRLIWGMLLFGMALRFSMKENVSHPLVQQESTGISVQIGEDQHFCEGCNPLIFGLGLNINQASASELEFLPGIGAQKAADILRYRENKRAFRSVEELDKVKGIGPATIERVRPYVYISYSDG